MNSELLSVTIRIEPTAVDRLDAIIESLQGAGLTEVTAHRRFMIINGSVARAGLPQLQHVPGVVSVRADRSYRAQ